MWTSIVGYFTDLSKITAVYGIIHIWDKSFDNQRVECQFNKNYVQCELVLWKWGFIQFHIR